MNDDPVLAHLLAAADASPGVLPLRLAVAGLLVERDRPAEALAHCTAALQVEPTNAEAMALLHRITSALAGDQRPAPGGAPDAGAPPAPPSTRRPSPPDASRQPARPDEAQQRFDWAAAEEQVADVVEPAFVQGGPGSGAVAEDVVRPRVRLADVGGMQHVKDQLELALLGPLRNPELAKAFGTSARGGLLLYGPPGCGKTFLASAVAGELGARFYPIGIADVLDMYIGNAERNLRDIFDTARRNAPCVLFFDELDGIGQKRAHLRTSGSLRTVVNSLLAELDSMSSANDGVFVLGATNHPWDVDTALRRPGRLDRMLLVLPPDPPARAAILQYHLRDRPLAGIDLDALVRATPDFSGADLAHLATTATQRAMAHSIRTGTVRPVTMADFSAALTGIRPSTGPWFDTARNVATFANGDGSYDDLVAYLRTRKR